MIGIHKLRKQFKGGNLDALQLEAARRLASRYEAHARAYKFSNSANCADQ